MATDFNPPQNPPGSPISKKKIRREDALAYHSSGRRGKIEVVPTKPCATARDLALAYTPGVAEPCLEIAKDPELSYVYTARGNLVAVVSNGTAVLGLGDIGPVAGKPVMEGKGVLFKRFADIDVFDINIDAKEVDKVCTVVKALEPTFGGINLEDIKAPECFIIEERLKKEMQIPVFHDDQHGTAIISGAALLNALELAGKDIAKVRVVVSGAGAAAIACTKFYISLGVKRENVVMVDTKGVVYRGRTEGMNPWKQEFASDTKARTLAEAAKGADVLLGCSVKGMFDQAMIRSMAKDPIVFAPREPGSGDQLPRGEGGARGRHHGDRPLRLPEPGEQRPRVPVHLPRRARRAREGDHRGDEDGGGARARRRSPRRTCRTPSRAPTAASASASAATTSSRSRSTRACSCGSPPRSRRRRSTAASPA